MSASSSSNDSLHVKSMLCRLLFPMSTKLRFDGKRAFSRVSGFESNSKVCPQSESCASVTAHCELWPRLKKLLNNVMLLS